ncbi:MAG: CPBP family intramembrane metalloprotease [Lachnospiraceae bacterium]|nr:CPBP family intramembrane metalloprotease [Lachnospiraceae bacterium]
MSNKKQLVIYLLICLPVTWLLCYIANNLNDGEIITPKANALSFIYCMMPAIIAFICAVISKEGIGSLNITPKLKGNVKIYVTTILVALLISILDAPLIMCIFFKDVAWVNPDISAAMMVFQIMITIAMGCVQFFVLMGEEIGWMGFVFPKLEKICGMNLAIVFTGIIRGLWHMVMLIENENFAKDFIVLILTNIFGGCLLVLLTKKSGSVVPASVFHALTNSLPGVMYSFIIINPIMYEKYENTITYVSYIPYVIIMLICFIILNKKSKEK